MRKFILILLVKFMLFANPIITISIADNHRGSDGIIIEQELVRNSLKNLGYEVEYEFYPKVRSLENVENGLADGDFPRIKERVLEFKNIFVVEEPLEVLDYSVYYIGASRVVEWDDLENKDIGVVFGSSFATQSLDKNLKNKTVEELKDLPSLLKMLKSGRVNYLFLSELYGDELIKLFSKEGIVKSKNVLTQSNFYLLMNKKNIKMKEKLEKEIKKEKIKWV